MTLVEMADMIEMDDAPDGEILGIILAIWRSRNTATRYYSKASLSKSIPWSWKNRCRDCKRPSPDIQTRRFDQIFRLRKAEFVL
jgi:hypothetical protein